MIKKPLQLAACCLNISEGRNQKLLEHIAKAAVSNQHSWSADYFNDQKDEFNIDNNELKCKASVISLYSDAIFNRGNITITGSIHYLSTAIFQACEVALDNISLKHHINCNHPRLGVIDLIPIHPISNLVSLNTCGEIARTVGEKLTTNYNDVDIFYFGAADEMNRGLVERRKEFKWFNNSSEKMNCGTTAIGATPYMSVLNIMLDTNDFSVGKDIAQNIRASSSEGLPGIQAMAFEKHNNKIEIACNVETNDLQSELPVFKTSFATLEERIKHLAAQHNISVLGQSLRGFYPCEAYDITQDALLNANIESWKERSQMMM